MFTLEDLLGQERGGEALQQISQTVGADPGVVNTAVQAALPTILNQLANNASSQQGAENLNDALERDHDGSLLDNLGSLGSLIFGGQSASPPTDGGGILGHIFGSSQGAVAQQISNHTGLDAGQVAQILLMLAPIVMSYLGRQKQEQNLDAGGLSNWLGAQQQQIQQSPQGGILNTIFDRDGDGSSIDDIASMAMSYLTKGR
jgi:hypothetical protein